jgi:hypothetical protein
LRRFGAFLIIALDVTNWLECLVVRIAAFSVRAALNVYFELPLASFQEGGLSHARLSKRLVNPDLQIQPPPFENPQFAAVGKLLTTHVA